MSAVRAGYKQTEVGVIPEDWEAVELSSCCEIITGFPFESSKFASSGTRLIRGSNVKRDEIDWSDSIAQYWPENARGVSRYQLRAGDVVIAMDGALVGRSFAQISENDLPALLVQRVACLRARRCEQSYISHSVRNDNFGRHCDDLKTNTAIPHISPADIRSYTIALPPLLQEQRAIAEALGDADGLIEALEALIAKKRAIKQGAMQDLLAGHLQGESVRLGTVLKVGHGRSQKTVEGPNGPYPILASGGQIGTANQFLYDRPSVLIGRKGTIDRPQYADTPFWTIDTLFYTVISEPNVPKYIYYRFCMIDWKQYNEASGVPSLNAGTIENIEIELHEPDEQRAIAAVLSDMDEEIAALEAKLTKTRAVKQGMMQVLLTGEIRLT